MTEARASSWSARIRVTLKPAVNDPQGLAIQSGLRQLGFADVGAVRAGKFFEIQIAAADRAGAEKLVGEICHRLLANTVIEDYAFELVGE